MRSLRKFGAAILAATALSLASCASLTQAVEGPSAAADATKLDETALLAAEVGYKAARVIVEAAVDEGRVKPGLAAKFFRLNGDINAVLVKARRAYDAANSQSYLALIAEVRPLIEKLWAVVAEQEKHDGV